MPYERLIQFLAGPLSTLIALGATAIMHTSISQNKALDTATFILTAIVTYAGHHKWLSNLPKWWETNKPTPALTANEARIKLNYPPVSAGSAAQTEPGSRSPDETGYGLAPGDRP